uniref:Uncharacterized protein n=1 Tax=Aegilops tauschii subsp. strangulata TaxID=200361 RepID=A0A453ERE6_AEGTS
MIENGMCDVNSSLLLMYIFTLDLYVIMFFILFQLILDLTMQKILKNFARPIFISYISVKTIGF